MRRKLHEGDSVQGADSRKRHKLRTWSVRALLVFAIFSFGVLYGLFAARTEMFPYSVVKSLFNAGEQPAQRSNGRMDRGRPMRAGPQKQKLTDAQREEMAKLMALGYLPGVRPAPKDAGVTIHDRELAFDGLNFLTSGHGPEAILMNMDGEVLHKWNRDFQSVWPWPDYEVPKGGKFANTEYWRRAYLFENGDVLAIFEGIGLIKIDKYSNLLWAYQGGCHHDLFVTDESYIYVLEREAKVIPRIHKQKPVLEDFIAVLNSEGELQRRVSILEAFEQSPYAPLLENMKDSGDLFHTNTIEVLDGKLYHLSPTFREGNVLVSILRLDTIAVVDMDTERVLWALAGRWKEQHQPTVLENGRMLLFNNIAGNGVSEVIEFDPFTQEVAWSYRGDSTNPFFTWRCGSSQRLPNGNTLITESQAGRAFEVTPDKTTVWEFTNPYRVREDHQVIALLLEMVRLPPDFPLDWLDK